MGSHNELNGLFEGEEIFFGRVFSFRYPLLLSAVCPRYKYAPKSVEGRLLDFFPMNIIESFLDVADNRTFNLSFAKILNLDV